LLWNISFTVNCILFYRDCRGRDRMVVGFCIFKSRSWRGVFNTTLGIKFVSDLRLVGGFLQVLDQGEVYNIM